MRVNHHEGTNKVTQSVKDHDGAAVKYLFGITSNIIGDNSQEHHKGSTVRPDKDKAEKFHFESRNDEKQDEADNGNDQEERCEIKGMTVAAIEIDAYKNKYTCGCP